MRQGRSQLAFVKAFAVLPLPVLPQREPEGHAVHSSNVECLPVNRASKLKSISMKSLQAVVASLALLAVGAPGIGGVVFTMTKKISRPGGQDYQAGYQQGYQHGYQHRLLRAPFRD